MNLDQLRNRAVTLKAEIMKLESLQPYPGCDSYSKFPSKRGCSVCHDRSEEIRKHISLLKEEQMLISRQI